jgi:hypothetical protein
MKRFVLIYRFLPGALPLLAMFCGLLSPAAAQIRDTAIQTAPRLQTAGRSVVRVVPGQRYDAGAIHRLFFGGLWRDLWNTPIDVPVLNLDTFAGGLKPLKKGGGFQTKSLRFQAANGRQYKFRSLDKDPAAVLPVDLRESLSPIWCRISSPPPIPSR